MKMTEQMPISKEAAKGFFRELFDLSFKTWVTLRVAGVLYALTLVIIAIIALVSMITLFTSGDVTVILLALIGVPLLTFLAVLVVRIGFESAIATIAIARNTEPRNLSN
jgi:hypothetical protein